MFLNVKTDRRGMLGACGSGILGMAIGGALRSTATGAQEEGQAKTQEVGKDKATDFQIACMTLPYSQYPLARALSGIQRAGYKHVAWGTTHKEEGEAKAVPVMPADASPEKARELGRRCRDMGLEPLMMFSMIYPEDPKAIEVLTSRIRQAEAAGVAHVLTFGHTDARSRKLWVERLEATWPRRARSRRADRRQATRRNRPGDRRDRARSR